MSSRIKQRPKRERRAVWKEKVERLIRPGGLFTVELIQGSRAVLLAAGLRQYNAPALPLCLLCPAELDEINSIVVLRSDTGAHAMVSGICATCEAKGGLVAAAAEAYRAEFNLPSMRVLSDANVHLDGSGSA